MHFERGAKASVLQRQLERLQSLNSKEKLVLFELTHRLGVTERQEMMTNFLSQLHSDHLAVLSGEARATLLEEVTGIEPQ